VVWGGQRDADQPYERPRYFNTGGRYDPIANTWAPTSHPAPKKRAGHTAVWTGSVMVVWGGSVGSGKSPEYLETGGRYDPVTNTWAHTDTTLAPTARGWHTAVWTGSRMVVWGGLGQEHFRTGGRYDPVSDTWAPTTTANAPARRSQHTAVWTGSLMVVWGGAGSVYHDTGGRYDPVADAWHPTTTLNAPDAREDHTAVWTGSTMLVWGGEVDGQAVDTGGQYGIFPTCASWWRPAVKN